MPIAITTRENFDFVLEAERDSEDKTVFHCRPLTTVEFNQICTMVGGEVSFLPYQAVKRGLVGWTNFKDASGKAIALETRGGLVSDRCVNMLAPADMMAIGSAIVNKSIAGTEDLGK